MYIPAHFAETRPDELTRIIRAHPLGMLVTSDSAGLDADHIPFEYEASAGTHGLLTVRDDERFVRGMVGRLTKRHEAGEPVPWKMSDAAPDYIDGLLRHIVGIEIAISSLVGKVKLSQNREARDRLNAADRLQARGHDAMASAMRQVG